MTDRPVSSGNADCVFQGLFCNKVIDTFKEIVPEMEKAKQRFVLTSIFFLPDYFVYGEGWGAVGAN